MDASKVLADLTEVSTQIEAAVIARRSGEVVATTIDDEARAGRFAPAAGQLPSAAGPAGPGRQRSPGGGRAGRGGGGGSRCSSRRRSATRASSSSARATG